MSGRLNVDAPRRLRRRQRRRPARHVVAGAYVAAVASASWPAGPPSPSLSARKGARPRIPSFHPPRRRHRRGDAAGRRGGGRRWPVVAVRIYPHNGAGLVDTDVGLLGGAPPVTGRVKRCATQAPCSKSAIDRRWRRRMRLVGCVEGLNRGREGCRWFLRKQGGMKSRGWEVADGLVVVAPPRGSSES